MTIRVAVLPGDGIGPEVTAEAVTVLQLVAEAEGLDLELRQGLIGGAALDAVGHPLPEATLACCRASRAVLLGAVGGPKWDNLPPELRPEAGALLPLRQALGLYANLRPVEVYPGLMGVSTLKEEVVRGTDLLVVRELTGGLYFGAKYREQSAAGQRAVDTLVYSEEEIRRLARVGFEAARKRRRKVTSVDKANVLESSRLWREVVSDLALEYPEIELNHMYVDNCAMQLVRNPSQFDVIITENMFGDILTDEASMVAGSIGLLSSASLGGEVALYEPAHGSAPDIAGQNQANPLAAILSVGLLCRYSLALEGAARRVAEAVAGVLAEGYRTPDLAQEGAQVVDTVTMGALVREKLRQAYAG